MGLIRAYLNLQQVIATNALIVHLMVRIVSITSVLILDKCKAESKVSDAQHVMQSRDPNLQSAAGRTRCRNITPDQATIARRGVQVSTYVTISTSQFSLFCYI